MARNTAPAGTKPGRSTAKKAPAKSTKRPAAKKAAAKTTTRAQNPRGWLAAEILKICKAYESGKLKVDGDKPLTPHRVALLVQKATGSQEPPSTGACAAVFARWEEFGFAIFSDKPKAFKKLTAKGAKDGLEGVILGRREARKTAHAKAKASK